MGRLPGRQFFCLFFWRLKAVSAVLTALAVKGYSSGRACDAAQVWGGWSGERTACERIWSPIDQHEHQVAYLSHLQRTFVFQAATL